MNPIYLDYAATTPIDPRVAEKMQQFLTLEGVFANPASTHVFGQAAKRAVDEARMQVAAALQAEPSEIIWTSGATEANNLALKGAAQLYQRQGKHIVTVKTEHAAVLDCCQQLEKNGFSVTYLTPEANGRVSVQALAAVLRPDTMLVSIMQVNNEIGIIQDIAAIAQLTAERGILLHVDAAQSMGKVSLDVRQIPVDLVSLCAHKVYGPKGIGALYVRRKPRVRVAAQMHGGGHEQGMRSGTLPTHQIVGMGTAFALAAQEWRTEVPRIAEMSRYFWQRLQAHAVRLNGDLTQGVPHILNFYFPNHRAESLMTALPNLAFSTGSACHARGTEPSYVLRALGLTAEEAHCCVRFSLGRFTTMADIELAVGEIVGVLT